MINTPTEMLVILANLLEASPTIMVLCFSSEVISKDAGQRANQMKNEPPMKIIAKKR
jgi:hypothetical protein